MLREPKLIGRSREMEKLETALLEAENGNGTTILVSGEPGLGKTTLVDAFRERAAGRDVTVLGGAASADTGQPFLIFTEALGEVVEKPLYDEQESKGFAKLFAVNKAGMLVAEASSGEEDMDADIFAGMLSAVQDFVRDSFDQTGSHGAGLGRLEYGNMKILIEHGSEIFLTGVFDGSEHADMKPLLKRTLTRIEDVCGQTLKDWSGHMEDIAPVQDAVSKLAEARFFVRRNLEGVNIEKERLRIADAVLDTLKAMSSEKPVAIFFEDLHWADESSHYILNYLARNIRSHSVFILGTLRPTESEVLRELVSNMKAEGIVEEMALEKLGPDDTVDIIDAMFPGNDFSEGLAEKLFEQAKGNPLFVVEMLNGMREDGSISELEGRFALVSDSYQIPATVEEVVNRRLETLDPDTMAMVEYASCIGQKFDAGIAASFHLLKEPGKAMEKLMTAGILAGSDGSVEFGHAVFQSVIYDGIGERWRTGHHKNIGEYFEMAHADNPDEVMYELARHFSRTKEFGKSADYCTRAGEKAETAFAAEQALEFYRDALEAFSKLDRTRTHDRALELMERMGDIQAVIGLYDDAIGNFQKAQEMADSTETKSRLLRKCSKIYTNNGEFDKALECTAEAKGALEGSETRELGLILMDDGTTLFRKGEFDSALEKFREALEILSDLPGVEDSDIAAVLNGIGNVHYHRGEMKDALEQYQKSLELNEKAGIPKEIALLLGNLGSVNLGLGKMDVSLDYFLKSLRIREKIGDILGIAQTQNNLGVIYQDRGELDKALEHFNKGLEISEKLGSKLGMSILLYNIGNLYHSKGQLDEALDIYERTMGIREELGDRQGLAYALYIIGRIHLYKGDRDLARENFEKSLAICQDIGDKQMVIHPMCGLTEMMLEDGEFPAALKQAGEAVAIAAEAGVRGEEGLSHRVLAMVHTYRDEFDKASEELEKARTILEEVGHREELARVFKEYAHLYKAKGEPGKAEESMAKAMEMFDEMGMVLWASECRKAMEDL